MNIKAVLRLMAFLLLVLGLCMLPCILFSIRYNDGPEIIRAILISAGITSGVGVILMFLTRGKLDEFSRRDGFGIVVVGWLLAANFGALPFMISGQIPDLSSAVFETMSGFTTTGASVVANCEAMPKGIMFWRCLTQWLGGMGVLVLCVAILPFLGVGGMQIYRAEVPGPTKDRLTPRIAVTAKLLWGVYLIMTVVLALALKLLDMSWFDALCHAFTTVSTGGFSTRTASVATYDSLPIELVLTFFMLLCSLNFSLHFRAFKGDLAGYFKDGEFRFFLALWAGITLLIAWNVWPNEPGQSFGNALRQSSFQTASIMTTTGFATEDFNYWPSASCFLLVLAMFFGGCAGSTSGGLKAIRVFIVIKKSIREIYLFMFPKAVVSIKIGQRPVDREIVSNIAAFVLIYILLFAGFTLVMTAFMPDLLSASTSVAASMGNVGPGLGSVGPMYNYEAVPSLGKIVLTFCMLLGRLELYTVLVMFLPSFWKR